MKLLTKIVLVLTFIVIVLGAYTRLKDAGLGCPDWPGCYGELLVPSSESEALENYPDAEFDAGKAWIEVVHRIFAGILSILVLALGINHLRLYRRREAGFGFPLLFLLTLVVIAGQVILGMLTVTLKLLPLIVTSHLLGGLLIFSLLFLYYLRLGKNDAAAERLPSVSSFGLVLGYLGLALIVAQIILGGWVSTNYAALACVDFPLCNGALVPPADFATGFSIWQPVGINYEGGVLTDAAKVAIHWTHRFGALVVVLFWAGFYFWLRRRQLADLTEAQVLLAVLLLQVMLGITNVLADLPLLIATAHNGAAAILLLSSIALLYKLHKLHSTRLASA